MRIYLNCIFCLAIAFLVVGQTSAQTYIRVGSFNIANFGDGEEKEYERSLISLVNIINEMDADVIAIQEVEPNQLGYKQMERLTNLLNKAAKFYNKKTYDFTVSNLETGDEFTAYLWRSPVSMTSEITLLEHDEDPDDDGKRTFQRVPTVAQFKAGNYDFYLVNCHLYTKVNGSSSEGRGFELEEISSWLSKLTDSDEKDALVIGDFNRFLNGKSPWEKIYFSGHEAYYRFPLLEAIKVSIPDFNPAIEEAPEDKYSTTTAKKLSIYDQIIISKGSYHEFVDTPEFGVDVGILAFDEDPSYE